MNMQTEHYILMNKDRFKHYTLGIPELDEHHWELFQILDEIKHSEKKDRTVCSKGLLELFFVKLEEHTEFEEQFMEEHGYPFLNAHKAAHPEATGKLKAIRDKLGKHEEVYVDISDMVCLLCHHIDYGDFQFADYYKSLKQAA